MSFGNRSNFCMLKDAFKPPMEVPVPIPQQPFTRPTVQIKEKFTEPLEIAEHHTGCSVCALRKKDVKLSIAFNEMLNYIFLMIILYIIIFKPRF